MDPLDNPLARYTEHSKQWWGAVYELHSAAAYRGVRAAFRTQHVSYDSAGLEDVVQEVFADLQETRAISNQTGNLGGYIRKCAYNEAIDRTRRQRKIADPVVSDDAGSNDPGDAGVHDEAFDRVEDLDEARRQAATARSNVERLTQQERRVARMLRQGLTREQIGFNEGISKTRVTHIKNSIRQKLQVGYGLRTDGTRMIDND